jgi:hypothetical protein
MPLRPMVLWMSGAALLALAGQGHAESEESEGRPLEVAAIRVKVDLSPSMDE